jgi:hypothetical protein
MTMKKILTSIVLWLLISIAVVYCSIKADIGKQSWDWLQRSGSVLVLGGAFLTYRSIFRLGINGVGGENVTCLTGKIVDAGEDTQDIPMAKISYDEKSIRCLQQVALDKRAGFCGALLMITGTLLWGYGDLLGKIFFA